jgi:hypothetical protein
MGGRGPYRALCWVDDRTLGCPNFTGCWQLQVAVLPEQCLASIPMLSSATTRCPNMVDKPIENPHRHCLPRTHLWGTMPSTASKLSTFLMGCQSYGTQDRKARIPIKQSSMNQLETRHGRQAAEEGLRLCWHLNHGRLLGITPRGHPPPYIYILHKKLSDRNRH